MGVTPLTERYRTAKYVDVKDGYTPGSKDVLSELRKNIFADPESADFQKQLKEVADFWESNFHTGSPMCNLIRTTAMNGLRSDGDLIII